MLSGVVAGISRITPYEAPRSGYFEGFAAQVFSRVSGTSGASGSGLSAASGLTGDGPSPAGADFPLSSVLQGITKNPFSGVPAGYFDDLASRILDRVRSEAELSELSPLLAGIGKKMPFQAPEGYFKTLAARLPGGASFPGVVDAGQPLEPGTGDPALSTRLAGLRSVTPYQAPGGYFEQFPDRMLAKARAAGTMEEQAAPAKVVSIGRWQSWWKLPAVAVAASVILVFGWLALHTSVSTTGNPAVNPDITKSLSNVSDQEIQNYLDNQNIPLADQLAGSTAAIDISDSDADSMLGEVSDAELKQYMEDHGNTKNLPQN